MASSFGACFFAYKDLAEQEGLVVEEILSLSVDVDWAAALGTDEEFAQAKAKLAAAEARLDEILKEHRKLDEDFLPHLEQFTNAA